MDMYTAIVLIVGMLLAAYVIRLFIVSGRDFEAGIRAAWGELFLRAKQRSRH